MTGTNSGERIPVIHVFDNKYVMPAAVAFQSLLSRANKNYFYELFVVHEDISDQNQTRLQCEVSKFENAQLSFVRYSEEISYQAKSLFRTSRNQAHFSAEMFVKFFLADLFPQYERIVVSDVDVVWLGDISDTWREAGELDGFYLGGVRGIEQGSTEAYRHFSQLERNSLVTQAGLWIFNLAKMRQDEISQSFTKYAFKNIEKIVLPEQDVVNLVCYPFIKCLSLRNLVCTFDFQILENIQNGLSHSATDVYSLEEIESACQNPVQLHFAGGRKPWRYPTSPMSRYWFRSLIETCFFDDWVGIAERFELLDDVGREIRLRISRTREIEIAMRGRIGKSPFFRVPFSKGRDLSVAIAKTKSR